MKSCINCQATIDEYLLDKELGPLRDLTVDDFNVCVDCVTVVPESCVACGGGVYVPRSEDGVPDYCPACRSMVLERTGEDPGWQCSTMSN